MTQFIFAYHGGHEALSSEECSTHMEKWMAWVGDLGDAMINPGTYFGKSKTLSSSGAVDTGSNRLTGYSIIEADDLDAALAMAKGCPHLNMGTIEVAEVMKM